MAAMATAKRDVPRLKGLSLLSILSLAVVVSIANNVRSHEWTHFEPQDSSAHLPPVPFESPKVSVLTDLLHLYKTLPNNTFVKSPPPFREISYAFPRNRVIPRDYVTLTTQISVSKFHRLDSLLERWNGPISCAVFCPDPSSIYQLYNYITSQSQLFRDLVTFHVMLEKPKGKDAREYPINRLRNLALHGIDTDFFFSSDVDFMPRVDAHTHLLKSLVGKRNTTRKFSTLYVLPAFEVFGDDTTDRNNSTVSSLEDVPKDKQALLEMLATRPDKVQPFHSDYHRKGHNATNFDRWYKCLEPGASYPITYQWQYEPYVVGNRYGVPDYNDRFRGFGLNKLTWAAEAHLTGYQFHVLCDHFVVHMNHPGRRNRSNKNPLVHEAMKWYRQAYLPGRYNYTWPAREALKSSVKGGKKKTTTKKKKSSTSSVVQAAKESNAETSSWAKQALKLFQKPW